MAIDDAYLDFVVDADMNGLLTCSAGATTATHRRTALARHFPDRRVDAAHPAASRPRRRRR